MLTRRALIWTSTLNALAPHVDVKLARQLGTMESVLPPLAPQCVPSRDLSVPGLQAATATVPH
ncbi:hypothetical protein DPMN_191870 [Dreissena polymorpha]|uniref:Uncharacterized protein n=1 Tax=Dreissena polymorpha TaxID=45954 RepID=A0A9D3Y1J3_DREPO|nr:hypothetical protein DPMN_191870 [Dreissena polymorpha]